jgi:hypothetical protein
MVSIKPASLHFGPIKNVACDLEQGGGQPPHLPHPFCRFLLNERLNHCQDHALGGIIPRATLTHKIISPMGTVGLRPVALSRGNQ